MKRDDRGLPEVAGELDTETALQELIDASHGRLVGLLRVRGCSIDEADDLAQDVMVRLVKHWAPDSDVDNWWAWLVTVAVNLQRSHWRRLSMAARRTGLLRPALAHYDPDALEILDLLADLTDRERTAVVLRHYAGLSIAETANAMGCATGTVKSLTAKGRSKAKRRAERSEVVT